MDHAPFQQYDYLDYVFGNANDAIDYIEQYLSDFNPDVVKEYWRHSDNVIDFSTINENLFDEEYSFNGDRHVALVGLEDFFNQPEIDDGIETSENGFYGVVQLVGAYAESHMGINFIDEENEYYLISMLNYIRGNTVFDKALANAGLTSRDEVTKENIAKFVKGLESQRANNLFS